MEKELVDRLVEVLEKYQFSEDGEYNNDDVSEVLTRVRAYQAVLEKEVENE